ncbi:MAG TPA: hypothetical protein VER32_05830 [Pyrinomonadaceae bacterium]|nr:hypothetical protein [Pyrinomonadaceae bacterium]
MPKKTNIGAALISAALISAALIARAPLAPARAQQIADPDFKPAVGRPEYKEGRGPVVCVDEAHFNFHTAGGRYAPFAMLLRGDGYVVRPSAARFTRDALKACRVLVISNAVGERNQTNWTQPIDSAFTDEEVAAVAEWVKRGGALFLIVDHMPMPGANDKLARAFGVRFSNGFALIPDGPSTIVFRRADGLIGDHAITRGRTKAERIEQVATFTGSAFRAAGATPILTFGDKVVSLEPQTAWQFTPETPKVDVKGWLQGAALRHGKGRVVVFGEAAMFTAQLAGPNKLKVGMNAPDAAQNPQLLLNIVHWLDGKLK